MISEKDLEKLEEIHQDSLDRIADVNDDDSVSDEEDSDTQYEEERLL